MNKYVSRRLWLTLLVGGLTVAGATAANAADVTGGDGGVASGTPGVISITLPVTIGGNSISLLGGSSSTGSTASLTPGDPTTPLGPVTPVIPATPAAPGAFSAAGLSTVPAALSAEVLAHTGLNTSPVLWAVIALLVSGIMLTVSAGRGSFAGRGRAERV